MNALQKVTTQYSEIEDRIRITGDAGGNHSISFWLSQRLLTRLLMKLFEWLERHSTNSTSEITQSFAQDAAKASLSPEKAVEPTGNFRDWLVVSIDITAQANTLSLIFKGDSEQSTTISFNELQLRQWLEILHSLWKLAQWPDTSWPDWFIRKESFTDSNSLQSMH